MYVGSIPPCSSVEHLSTSYILTHLCYKIKEFVLHFVPNIEQAGHFKIPTIYPPASKVILPLTSLYVNKIRTSNNCSDPHRIDLSFFKKGNRTVEKQASAKFISQTFVIYINMHPSATKKRLE